MKRLLYPLILVFILIILVANTRGDFGNPDIIAGASNQNWENNFGGAFENSSARSRYALVYSLIEDSSFRFSYPLAKFSLPDVAGFDGNYVSLFAPGTSLISIPGFIIGSKFGMAQIGSFFTITIFALFNFILVNKISRKLGANNVSATLGGLIFLFASPSFSYAITLYQHHITTFIILLSIYSLLSFKNAWGLMLVWILSVLSIIVDYPNFFLMLPVGLFALGKIFLITKNQKAYGLKMKIPYILTFIVMAIPISFFMWFNMNSYDGPLRLAGTLSRVRSLDQDELSQPESQSEAYINNKGSSKKTPIRFFKTRNLLNGFYTHFMSPDRGILVYTPIMFFGLLGVPILYKKKPKIFALFIAILGINILVYSMWGDPWGGWAFGSRYLIPAYSILSIFIAIALTNLRKRYFLQLIFLGLTTYSVYINTLGAVTTNNIPPKIEVLALEKITQSVELYDYNRNIEYLNNNNVNTLSFNVFANDYVTGWQYFYITFSAIMTLFLITSLLYLFDRERIKT